MNEQRDCVPLQNDHESTIFFTKDEVHQPFHKLQIQWHNGLTVENLLVVVHDKGGNLSGLLLSDKPKFAITCTGCQREEIYAVNIYGLKRNTAPGQIQPSQHSDVTASGKGIVDSSDKMAVKKDVLASVVRLSEHTLSSHDAFLINILKVSQRIGSNDTTRLGVVINQKPPLEYTIVPTVPLTQEVKGLIAVRHGHPQRESLIVSSGPLTEGIPLPSVSKSRTVCQIRVLATCDSRHCQSEDITVTSYQGCRNSDNMTIKAYMVQEDLLQLLEMAKNYCSNNTMRPRTYHVTHFYRNKPQDYYNDIFLNHDGVMKKYIKDNNGDPYSPVNNRINGLFFSVSINPYNRNPPNFSYYGDTRLFIPVEEMLTVDTNIYFTDFYCHYETHYVTLVLTKKGSEEDQFCQGRLIQLDPRDNPFFWVEEIPYIPDITGTTSLHLQQGCGQHLGLNDTINGISRSTFCTVADALQLNSNTGLNPRLSDTHQRQGYDSHFNSMLHQLGFPMYGAVQDPWCEGVTQFPIHYPYSYTHDTVNGSYMAPVYLPLPCHCQYGGYVTYPFLQQTNLGGIPEENDKETKVLNYESLSSTSSNTNMSEANQKNSHHDSQSKLNHVQDNCNTVTTSIANGAQKDCSQNLNRNINDKDSVKQDTKVSEPPAKAASKVSSWASEPSVCRVFKTKVVSKFHVEFFYTEDIDIARLMRKHGQQKVYFQVVEGRGQSRKEGIPKRQDCAVCNLPPVNSFY